LRLGIVLAAILSLALLGAAGLRLARGYLDGFLFIFFSWGAWLLLMVLVNIDRNIRS